MSSTESDSDDDIPQFDMVMGITKEEATKNYNEAGHLVPEEAEQINLSQFGHLNNPQNEPILQQVLTNLALPYDLAAFQTVSIHTLMEKKDILLLSPTGSGKGSLIESNFNTFYSFFQEISNLFFLNIN